MAHGSFAQRIVKDLKRNPKKTAILALLLCVAVWFWTPLVWKWAGWSAAASPTPDGNAGGPAAVADTGSAAGKLLTSDTIHTLHWSSLSEQLKNRQLVNAAEWAAESPDPFGRAKQASPVPPVSEDEEPESQQPPTLLAAATPQELGLALRSTATGGGVRLAQINGQMCGVGDVLVVPVGGTAHEFKVIHIAAESVTLQSYDRAYVLERSARKTAAQLTRADSGKRVMFESLRRE